MMKTVAIGGLGAIGLKLARALDAGVDGLRLIAVAARDQAKAETNLRDFRTPPRLVTLDGLADADIVVEAAPAAVFEAIASAAIEAGRIFVPASVGALLPRMHLVRRAQETGAASGRRPGRRARCGARRGRGRVDSVTIESRKPPRGLEGAPYLVEHRIDVRGLTAPKRVFEGNAFDAAAGFPANVNVAAALALAGICPPLTRVEIWADPGIDRNTHTIRVEAEAARFTMTIENVPSAENPRTGRSPRCRMLACLRGLVATLKGRHLADQDVGGTAGPYPHCAVRILLLSLCGAAPQRHVAGGLYLPRIYCYDPWLHDVGLCLLPYRVAGECRLVWRC